MADRYICHACKKRITATKNLRFRTHTDGNGDPCPTSSDEIPQHQLDAGPVDKDADPGVPERGRDFAQCPACDRDVKLTALGYFEPHNKTLRGADRCPLGGVRYEHARKVEQVLLPGEEGHPRGALAAHPKVSDQAVTAEPAPVTEETSAPGPDLETDRHGDPVYPEEPTDEEWAAFLEASENPYRIRQPGPVPGDEESSPESESTSTDSVVLIFGGKNDGSVICQPGSPITQPGTVPEKGKMSERELEIAARVKEIFLAYQRRKTDDNRSAQTTLGPSEVGTPCDRRLAMSLMGVEPVNSGGDGWAAFVGTWMHEGMKAVFDWADGNTGRFATEVPLTFQSDEVPRGTTDLIWRTLFLVVDWKGMGEYSLKKFIADGPTDLYRIQGQIYAYGATLQGEKIREVAIIGLPRAGRSLDEMWVSVEKYDRKVALAALARVKKIRKDLGESATWAGLDVNATNLKRAQSFGTAADCTYCPFHMKGDKTMQKGCPGAS